MRRNRGSFVTVALAVSRLYRGERHVENLFHDHDDQPEPCLEVLDLADEPLRFSLPPSAPNTSGTPSGS